jgi:hypothetical protein
LKAHAFSLTYEVNEPKKKPNCKNIVLTQKIKQGECHGVALPFTLKKYLKAKEEL